jgi:hypothetical protein
MKKTHWRQIAGKEFLIGEMLNGQDTTLTIKEVKIEELQNKAGKENKPVISFEKTDYKLVLNVTNMKTIAKVLGTPYIEEWAGQNITLTPIKGRFFGEEQEVIRIKQNFQNVKV